MIGLYSDKVELNWRNHSTQFEEAIDVSETKMGWVTCEAGRTGWRAGVKQKWYRPVGERKKMMMIRWSLRPEVHCTMHTRGIWLMGWDVWGYDTFRYLMGFFLVGTFSLFPILFATRSILLFHRLTAINSFYSLA